MIRNFKCTRIACYGLASLVGWFWGCNELVLMFSVMSWQTRLRPQSLARQGSTWVPSEVQKWTHSNSDRLAFVMISRLMAASDLKHEAHIISVTALKRVNSSQAPISRCTSSNVPAPLLNWAHVNMQRVSKAAYLGTVLLFRGLSSTHLNPHSIDIFYPSQTGMTWLRLVL